MLSLVSCGLGEQEDKKGPAKEKIVEVKEPEVRYTTIMIFENEPFKEDLYIPNLREGDEIIIEVKGQSLQHKFSRVYNKNSISTWEEKICINLPFPKRKECFKVPKQGNCTSKFRDHVGINTSPIKFNQNSIDTRVTYLMGDQKLYFPPSKSSTEETFKAKLKVTKEMVEYSHDLHLRTLPRENKGNVKIGFLGFKKCDGILQPKFNAGISQKSHSVINSKEYEFLANVSIRYIE